MPKFEYFKPYEGDKPYIFISYAHVDDAEVLPIISDMHKRGYNIWYDEGIEVGSEWQECIASHLADAHLVIAFISNGYMKSDNCRREMHYALSKRIKTINVFLEKTDLTPGMELQIGNIFALMKYTYPSEEHFFEKLYTAPLLGSENFSDADNTVAHVNTTVRLSDKAKKKERKLRKRKERRERKEQRKENRKNAPEEVKEAAKSKKKKITRLGVALVVLGCLIAALIVGYFTGYIERLFTKTTDIPEISGDTVAEFKSDVFEAVAREYTGIESGDITVGDLKGLTALYICGDRYWFTAPSSDIAASSVADGEATITDSDGNKVTVSRGSVKDLSDLAYFTDLKTLHLQFQTLNGLGTLPACGIETLNLDSCRLASLEGIGNLPNLKELSADGNPISSFGDLKKCLELKSISCLGASCTDFTVFKPLLKIESIAFSDCTLSDVSHVLDHGSLRSVTLINCDLTGSFFKSFDSERSILYLDISGSTLDSTSGLNDFTSLTELRITNCTGISDWSELESLTALKTLYISADLRSSIGDINANIIEE